VIEASPDEGRSDEAGRALAVWRARVRGVPAADTIGVTTPSGGGGDPSVASRSKCPAAAAAADAVAATRTCRGLRLGVSPAGGCGDDRVAIVAGATTVAADDDAEGNHGAEVKAMPSAWRR
jgi:hypothetical protein